MRSLIDGGLSATKKVRLLESVVIEPAIVIFA